MSAEELENIPPNIFFPNSAGRYTWDIIIILFVLYNVMILPVDIGLTMEVTPIRELVEHFIDAAFLCDIAISFYTGYVDENSKLVMNKKMIT